MKRSYALIALLWLMTTSAIQAQEPLKYLWPIEGAKVGTNILAKPQSYLGSSLNFGSLFIGAPLGATVVAPTDGVVESVGLTYYSSMTSSIGWQCNGSFDQVIQEVTKTPSDKYNPKYVSGNLGIKCKDGSMLYISGLSGDRVFKTGQQVRRGEVLGKVAYSFKEFHEPSLCVSISKNSLSADPMTPFGLQTTFVAPKKIEPIATLPPAKVKEDFLFLIEAIKECFPALDDLVSEQELDTYVQHTVQQIEASKGDWSMMRVNRLMRRTTALVHDSHISLHGPQWNLYHNIKFVNYPQLIIGWVDGTMRCANATATYKHLIGRPIRTLNGMSADSVFAQHLALTGGYDAQVESYPRYVLTRQFDDLFSNPDGTSYNFDATLVMGDTDEVVEVKGSKKYEQMARGDLSFFTTNRHPAGYKTQMLNDSTAMVGLSHFGLNQTAVEDIGRFIDSVERTKVAHLIIDVRNNSGGNDEVISQLYGYIAGEPFAINNYSRVNSNKFYKTFAQSMNRTADDDLFANYVAEEGKKGFYSRPSTPSVVRADSAINYKGRVYVLTNENSVSAATLFPAMLIRGHRGVTVGRETRTAYHFMNALKFVDIRLPHSTIGYTLPLVYCCFDTVVNDRVPYGRGVLPDYEVPFSVDEYTSQNGDAILNHTLALIQQGKYLSPNNPFEEQPVAESKGGVLGLIAWISILSAVGVAVGIYVKTRQRPEPMKVMNIVWVLTALWGSFGALFFYRKWSAKKPKMAGMPMDMAMDRSTPMPKQGIWRSVALSTLHCGAGCALADLVGEGATYFFPLAIAGSVIAGSWALDFVLALLFGVFFQYAAMKQMQPSEPWRRLVGRAAKADVLSLTAWQVGMYGWMAICYFVIFPHGMLPKDSATFWLMMQIAMLVGFCTALPMNYLLIRLGVKQAM